MRALNILIADDDDQNQAMMKLILSRQGHNVKSSWTGVNALEAVKSEKFDLVFMDIHMPEMDGLEATRQIRKWENKKQHIPIVILTGSVPENKTEEYKNAGADTFLFKPFDIKRISMLIQIIAEETDINFQIDNQQIIVSSETELQLLDYENSMIRFNNDTKLYCDNLAEFIQSLPGRFEKIESALKERHWNELFTFAHNLKGVAANFGANQLSRLAKELEVYSQGSKFRLAKRTIREMNQNRILLTKAANTIIDQQHSQNSDLWEGQ